MTDSTTSILWVRNDFRVGDNPALSEACERGHVLPVYIYASADAKLPGGATLVWLYHALRDFAGALEQYKRSRAPAQPYGAGGGGGGGATAGDFLSAWLQQAMRVSEGGGGGGSVAAHGIEDNE